VVKSITEKQFESKRDARLGGEGLVRTNKKTKRGGGEGQDYLLCVTVKQRKKGSEHCSGLRLQEKVPEKTYVQRVLASGKAAMRFIHKGGLSRREE